MSDPVCVVAEPQRAMSLLDPVRQRILEALGEPASAVALADRLAVPRQRLNYHLQELKKHGLVLPVHDKERGSVREIVWRRTGDSFAISPEAIGRLGSRPEHVQDRFSSAYQIAVASQAIADLGRLRDDAAAAGKVLPTLSLEVDVRFASAAARSTFAQELTDTIAALVQKHHDARARGGRTFRFYLGGYPRPAAD